VRLKEEVARGNFVGPIIFYLASFFFLKIAIHHTFEYLVVGDAFASGNILYQHLSSNRIITRATENKITLHGSVPMPSVAWMKLVPMVSCVDLLALRHVQRSYISIPLTVPHRTDAGLEVRAKKRRSLPFRKR
jgi:hypothetical protein